MRRTIIVIVVVMLASVGASADLYMKIHKAGGNTSTYRLSEITKMTFNLTGVSNEDLGRINGIFRPLALLQNYPNPFSPTTRIEYSLPGQMAVELTVYNISGQRVRCLAQGRQPAGRHTIAWDGRDETGRRCANGAYLYQLKADSGTLTRKMVILK